MHSKAGNGIMPACFCFWFFCFANVPESVDGKCSAFNITVHSVLLKNALRSDVIKKTQKKPTTTTQNNLCKMRQCCLGVCVCVITQNGAQNSFPLLTRIRGIHPSAVVRKWVSILSERNRIKTNKQIVTIFGFIT